jgi:hypothetical protein
VNIRKDERSYNQRTRECQPYNQPFSHLHRRMLGPSTEAFKWPMVTRLLLSGHGSRCRRQPTSYFVTTL